jgi:thiol-disulfide isomerase/thioredoxin
MDGWSLGDVLFPDLDGAPRSLADPEFAGRARIVQVFGSWCPNCNDEGRYLAGLLERYGDRGLSVLGLAFELTGDFDRDAKQVRRYLARNGVDYPVLIAGTANKRGATRAFPALDFVRSYPTTIFLRQDGSVRAVHSGFSGPATGAEHLHLRAEFEGLIEELLAEEPDDHHASWNFLEDRRFVEEGGVGPPRTLGFRREGGGWRAIVETTGPAFGDRPVEEAELHLAGDSLVFGDEVLRIDRTADALLDPRRFERRFVPAGAEGARDPELDESAWLERVADSRGARRREAVIGFAKCRLARGSGGPWPYARWLEDESLHVELAAIWSTGVLREESARLALIERLADANAAVRREAALALGRLGPTEKGRERLEALASDSDPFVRLAAAEALGG